MSLTRVSVVFNDGPELCVGVGDVGGPDEADREPALGDRGRHGHPIGPALAPDLVVHPVGHVLEHHPDCGNLRIFPVVDLELENVSVFWVFELNAFFQ